MVVFVSHPTCGILFSISSACGFVGPLVVDEEVSQGVYRVVVQAVL
jgi:hypothetical protein